MEAHNRSQELYLQYMGIAVNYSKVVEVAVCVSCGLLLLMFGTRLFEQPEMRVSRVKGIPSPVWCLAFASLTEFASSLLDITILSVTPDDWHDIACNARSMNYGLAFAFNKYWLLYIYLARAELVRTSLYIRTDWYYEKAKAGITVFRYGMYLAPVLYVIATVYFIRGKYYKGVEFCQFLAPSSGFVIGFTVADIVVNVTLVCFFVIPIVGLVRNSVTLPVSPLRSMKQHRLRNGEEIKICGMPSVSKVVRDSMMNSKNRPMPSHIVYWQTLIRNTLLNGIMFNVLNGSIDIVSAIHMVQQVHEDYANKGLAVLVPTTRLASVVSIILVMGTTKNYLPTCINSKCTRNAETVVQNNQQRTVQVVTNQNSTTNAGEVTVV